jgi:hypothetical protein
MLPLLALASPLFGFSSDEIDSPWSEYPFSFSDIVFFQRYRPTT